MLKWARLRPLRSRRVKKMKKFFFQFFIFSCFFFLALLFRFLSVLCIVLFNFAFGKEWVIFNKRKSYGQETHWDFMIFLYMPMGGAVNIAKKNFQPNQPSSLGDITNFVCKNGTWNMDKFTSIFSIKLKAEVKITGKIPSYFERIVFFTHFRPFQIIWESLAENFF